VRLARVAFLMRDYEEAVRWFTDCLGFKLVEDASAAKRTDASSIFLKRAISRATTPQ
jgi:catechol 2,3-dioxygenase-like lactoylglutathione lyase family enzyme